MSSGSRSHDDLIYHRQRKYSDESQSSGASHADMWPTLVLDISTKLLTKKDIPPFGVKPLPESSEAKRADNLDVQEVVVRIDFEEHPIHYEPKLHPELRNAFFEQNIDANCVVVANEFSQKFKDEHISQFYPSVIRKSTCRKFLLELHGLLADIAESKDEYQGEYAQLYQECLKSIHSGPSYNNSVDIHDVLRQRMTECILFVLQTQLTLNHKWQMVQSLLHTCPIVADSPAHPVFSVEPVGRDGWTLTTYGENPHQHQLFPGVPLEIADEDGLVYTATLQRPQHKRRLRMLDQS